MLEDGREMPAVLGVSEDQEVHRRDGPLRPRARESLHESGTEPVIAVNHPEAGLPFRPASRIGWSTMNIKPNPVKYIFITGGVVSSLGKGLAAASIGRLLEARGFRVTLQKFDPYLNVDPGLMSPFQHGEVYVTDDGTEADLDLGHYERFTSTRTTKDHNFTTGKIYESVIQKERKGEYLGATVQVVPHITDEIQDAIRKVSEGIDIQIVEIGGTVGDIESLPFLEAIRQFRLEVGPSNAIFVHLTLVPFIGATGELKTKPTQHSVRELRAIGIQPDILLCRTDRFLPQDLKRKIAFFCNMSEPAVITAKDVPTVYEVPLALGKEGLDALILKLLDLPYRDKDLDNLPHRTVILGNTNEGPPLIYHYRARPDGCSVGDDGKIFGAVGECQAGPTSGPAVGTGAPPFRPSDPRAVGSGPVRRSARIATPTGGRGPPFFAVSRA